MRELKFRAWDIKGKFWHTNHDFLLSNDEEKKCLELKHSDVVFIQFTGIKDKNGKEIYFDDIVSWCFYDPDYEDEDEGGEAVIVPNMGGGAGILFDWEIDRSQCYAVTDGGQIEDIWDDMNVWNIEVIGNIHDTPELLKKD